VQQQCLIAAPRRY